LHGETIRDDFAWMRRVDSLELHDYLAAENDWTAQRTEHLADLRATIFDELASVLPEDDVSAPWRKGAFDYRLRRPQGEQYRVHLRRPAGQVGGPDDGAGDAAEQVLLDENVLAAGTDYLDLGVCEVSPNGRLLAYSVDHEGNEVFTLRVRDIATGDDLPDQLFGTYYGLAWAADSNSFFYTTIDEANRPHQVHRHVIGTTQHGDELVWHELDRRFELEIEATRSGDFVVLAAFSRDTSEMRLVPAADPARAAVVVQPRERGREYHLDHQRGPDGGRLLLVVDDAGPEFRLVELPVALVDGTDQRARWREVLPHRHDVRVLDVAAFADHLVVAERAGGQHQLRVLDADGHDLRVVRPDIPGEDISLGRNEEYDVAAVRVVREGWVRPPGDFDHSLADGHESHVHTQQVLWGLDDYHCELVEVTAPDGSAVPLSLVTRRPGAPGEVPAGSFGSAGTGPRPCLLYGYGAYESSADPEFSYQMRPLLDRGFVFAIAHVRGGGERGRAWWLQGRLLSKRNTFTDFVACAQHLVDTGVTSPELLVARGISAGGLLMGAAAFLAPELFRAMVVEVPFVDVVNSMLDDTLPLTVGEWDEWGDPREPDVYAYMRSYSPYENLPGPHRPALLVTGSRHDPRVSVHEPAKWVAQLRADGNQGDAELLLQTAMGGGAHTGPAGRYDAWRHEALLHAFVIDAVTPPH
jgi:oligopeptidase B